MTGDDLLLIRELKDKVHQLFGLIGDLERGKEKLEAENRSLREEITNLNLEKQRLLMEYENLKLSEIIASACGDRQEARRRINILLREIDRCIALLNR